MSKIVITIEGDELEIGEATDLLVRLAEDLASQGFASSGYEVGPEQDTLALVGRSMQ